jgi:arylsulfatase
MLYAAQSIVGEFLETFKAFPPRPKAGSFTVDQAMDMLEPAAH